MAKLIRCPSGHIYDSQSHDACPECARAGAPKPVSVKAAIDQGGSGSDKAPLPTRWLAIGGAAVVVLAVAGFLLLRPSGQSEIVVVADAMSDPDFASCRKTVGEDLEACERAVASKKFGGPALAALYSSRGAGHAKKNDTDAGIADATEAIRLDPTLATAFSNRGAMYRTQRKFDEALRDFEQAIKLDAKFPNTYLNRGGLYLDRGEFDRAIADYDKAIEIDAKYFQALWWRGIAYQRKGDLDHAIADYDRVIELDPNRFASYWARGGSYLRKGDREHAIADFKQALSLNPDDKAKQQIETALNAATAGAQSQAPGQQPAPAAAPGTISSEAEAKSDPDYQTCENSSGAPALEACERALASGKFGGAALSGLYTDRGVERAHKNDLDGAIADYDEAIRLNASNATAFSNRGRMYERKDQPDRAVEDYNKAIELNPDFAVAYGNRAHLFLVRGDYDRAIKDLTELVRLRPDFSAAYESRGDAYRRKGDRDHAIADYNKALTLNPEADQKTRIEAALGELSAGSSPTAANSPPPEQAPQSSGQQPAGSSPSSSSQATASGPTADPDYQACVKGSGDRIAACDKAIASGKFSGRDLALLHNFRGGAQGAQGHYDAAVSDFSEAIKIYPSRGSYLSRGVNFRRLGRLDEALQDFNKAIEFDPKYTLAYITRGDFYASKRDYDRAIQDFSEAIKLDPKSLRAYKARGDAYRRKGDKEPATADYEKALSLNPSDDDKKQINAALYALGSTPPANPPQSSAATSTPSTDQGASASSGDEAPADNGASPQQQQTPETTPNPKVLKTEEEVFADPDFKACRSMGTQQLADCDRAIASGKFEGKALGALYNNRGQARGLNNDDDGALKDFNKAIELNPAAAPYNNRGTIYTGKGEYDLAIADYDKAIAIGATRWNIFQGRGRAYWEKGDLQRAAEDYEKALSLNPPPKLKERVEQDLEKIEARLKASTESSSPQKDGGAPATNADAGKSQEPGSTPSAKVLKSEDEILADPDFKACAMTDNQQIADCDRAIASGKFEGEGLAALHNARGQARYNKNDLDGALDDYTKALEADGTFASSYGNRGLIYIDKKDYDRAIDDFDHAIEIDGDKDYHPFDNRGLAYWSKGDTEHAVSDYKKALSLNPPDKARLAIEKSLKDIEGGAKYPPGTAPPSRQGSSDAPDDNNAAPSGLSDGHSGGSSGNSESNTQQGQGSSLSLVRPEDSEPSSEISPEGQASPVPGFSAGVGTTMLPGVYRLKGTNPEGEAYSGTAALTNDGKKFRFIAFVYAKTYRATAQFKDGILKLRYGKNNTVNFKLNSDGSLDATWGEGGTERLEPFAFTGTTELPLAEGTYSVSGRHANGKVTSATVEISKEGGKYHLDWRGDDGEYWAGSGKLAHNILLLSAAENPGWDKDSAAAYAVLPDGSVTGLYNSGLGQEKLTPIGSRPTPTAENKPQSKPEAASDPKKDANSCMTTVGLDTIPACDRAIGSGHFGTLDLATLHNRRGALQFMDSKDDDAIAEFSEAIRLDGNSANYFGNRGNAFIAKGDFDKAIADLDEAIRLAPNDFSYHENRGFAHLKKQEKGLARDDFNKALSLNPDTKHKKDIEQALKELGPDYRNMKMQ